MPPSGSNRRFLVLLILAFGFVSLMWIGSHREPAHGLHPAPVQSGKQGGGDTGPSLTGHAIAPKLGNATVKYVLLLEPTSSPQLGAMMTWDMRTGIQLKRIPG